MSVSDKIEEIKDYYHIGEWLEHAIQNKQDLPEILNTIWKKHGAALASELQSLSEQIDLLSEESFKGFSDLVQNKGKLAKLKSTHMAVELQLTNARREIGKRVFERKDELQNVSDDLDQLFEELEHVLEHSALEVDLTTYNQTAQTKTLLWPGEYKTGIILFKIISIFGWVLIVAGLIVVIISVFYLITDDSPLAMMIMPAFSTAIGGVFMVGYGQLARSILENTNNTREMLEIMKNNQIKDED